MPAIFYKLKLPKPIDLIMPEYVHLHCHTQFSLLDGASSIGDMMEKAARDGQKGVALTDHGNMFGAFKFVAEAKKRQLKPIIGCEFYLVQDRSRKVFSRAKGEQDQRFHQLLLAKKPGRIREPLQTVFPRVYRRPVR